jgi:hypothetical protein
MKICKFLLYHLLILICQEGYSQSFFISPDTKRIDFSGEFNIYDSLSQEQIEAKIKNWIKQTDKELIKVDSGVTRARVLSKTDNNLSLSYEITIASRGPSPQQSWMVLDNYLINEVPLESHIQKIGTPEEATLYSLIYLDYWQQINSLIKIFTPTHEYSSRLFQQIKSVKAFAFDIKRSDKFTYKYDSITWSNASALIKLNDAQTGKLVSLLEDPLNFSSNMSLCYIPHHNFFLYNTGNEKIGTVEICFECSMLTIYIDTKKLTYEFEGSFSGTFFNELVKICEEIKLEGNFTELKKKQSEGTD